jgi:hypothetical protein
MIAAPLLATVVQYYPCKYSKSPTAPITVELTPFEGKLVIVAWLTSGY